MKTNIVTRMPVPSVVGLPIGPSGHIRWVNLSQAINITYNPDDLLMTVDFVNGVTEIFRGNDALTIYQEMCRLTSRFERF